MLSTTGIPRTNPAKFTWHEESCIAHAQGWQASTTWVMEKSCASEFFKGLLRNGLVFLCLKVCWQYLPRRWGLCAAILWSPSILYGRKTNFVDAGVVSSTNRGAVGRFNKYFVGSRWACKGLRRLTSSTNFRKRQGLAGCQSAVV